MDLTYINSYLSARKTVSTIKKACICVMIKYNSDKQISIEEFKLPFKGKLSKENRWVFLARHLPWDEMVSVYVQQMSKKMGRPAKDPRLAIGAMIIKHIKRLADEDTVQEIRENPYLQYFLGYSGYSYDQPFTSSLFVSFRRRLGEAAFKELTERFIEYVNQVQKKSKGKKGPVKKDQGPDSSGRGNKGHLILDASVAPSDIKYPTDLDLLNHAREKSEMLIDKLFVPGPGKVKPRTYRIKARKAYLATVHKRKKSKKLLRKAIGQQLRYLRRNIKTIERLLDEKKAPHFPLDFKYQRLYWIIRELYRQQKQMYDQKTHQTDHRIVSISQPHVRPIVRGKAGRDVEFGAKLSLSLADGYSYLDHISWDAYNESTFLRDQIQSYQYRFGCYPEWVSADKIYGSRENRRYMKSLGIKYTGHALGRPKMLTNDQRKKNRERKKYSRQRCTVEGKFAEAKRRYDLACVKAKLPETSESWIAAVIFSMNISRYLRVIFLSIINMVKNGVKMFAFDLYGKNRIAYV